MNGTGTMWIAWDCQSSQWFPNINYSSQRRSCVLSSPFQRAAPRHWESGGDIRPGSTSRSMAKPSCCQHRACARSRTLPITQKGCY